MSKEPTEGMEKRGVVKEGWTPPEESQVSPGCKKAAGKPTEEELDDDFTKRAAKRVEDTLD